MSIQLHMIMSKERALRVECRH